MKQEEIDKLLSLDNRKPRNFFPPKLWRILACRYTPMNAKNTEFLKSLSR